MANSVQPAVRLRPMTETEFAAWREIAIRHHAAQVNRASGKQLDTATDESRALLAKVLASGLATEKMNLFVIVDGSDRDVGWLWLGASPHDPSAGFVFDIIIEEDQRGRGYGRATMHAAEQFFLAQGRSSISLDVAGGNDIARTLYESLGYRSISTSMSKRL